MFRCATMRQSAPRRTRMTRAGTRRAESPDPCGSQAVMETSAESPNTCGWPIATEGVRRVAAHVRDFAGGYEPPTVVSRATSVSDSSARNTESDHCARTRLAVSVG